MKQQGKCWVFFHSRLQFCGKQALCPRKVILISRGILSPALWQYFILWSCRSLLNSLPLPPLCSICYTPANKENSSQGLSKTPFSFTRAIRDIHVKVKSMVDKKILNCKAANTSIIIIPRKWLRGAPFPQRTQSGKELLHFAGVFVKVFIVCNSFPLYLSGWQNLQLGNVLIQHYP